MIVFDSFPSQMLESLESFGGLEFNDEFAEEMAEELFDIMPPLDRWTGSEFSKSVYKSAAKKCLNDIITWCALVFTENVCNTDM